MSDTRIAYGVVCTWWDSIEKVGKTPPGKSGHSIPCCPNCGGVLYELPNEEKWFEGSAEYEAAGHPGYRKMLEWGRGRCFKGFPALEQAYKTHLAEQSK